MLDQIEFSQVIGIAWDRFQKGDNWKTADAVEAISEVITMLDDGRI
ncbi:hypothetical protein N9C56_14185 [Paracoccaceae bacterium]|nr:hypothetical protein [Paracoccaceae bacterium]